MSNKEENCRCNLTIDLEEILMAQDREFTKVRATVYWKSGRVEVIEDDLKIDGTRKLRFHRKISALRDFPTVEKISIENIK